MSDHLEKKEEKFSDSPVKQEQKPPLSSPVSTEYQRAYWRVFFLKLFYVHALVYAAVNSLLLLIDVLTGGPLWFFWPLFGWGIGLAFHAGLVWGMPHVHAWEDRMIQRELSRRNG